MFLAVLSYFLFTMDSKCHKSGTSLEYHFILPVILDSLKTISWLFIGLSVHCLSFPVGMSASRMYLPNKYLVSSTQNTVQFMRSFHEYFLNKSVKTECEIVILVVHEKVNIINSHCKTQHQLFS